MRKTMKAFFLNFKRPDRSKQLINEEKLIGGVSEISNEVCLR